MFIIIIVKINYRLSNVSRNDGVVINDLDIDKLRPMDVDTFTFAEAASMSAGSVMKESLIIISCNIYQIQQDAEF